jgi:hypothetical protein
MFYLATKSDPDCGRTQGKIIGGTLRRREAQIHPIALPKRCKIGGKLRDEQRRSMWWTRACAA